LEETKKKKENTPGNQGPGDPVKSQKNKRQWGKLPQGKMSEGGNSGCPKLLQNVKWEKAKLTNQYKSVTYTQAGKKIRPKKKGSVNGGLFNMLEGFVRRGRLRKSCCGSEKSRSEIQKKRPLRNSIVSGART